MKKRHVLSALCAALACSVLLALPARACLLVTSDGAALRDQPADKGKVLERRDRGAVLRMPGDGTRGDWFKVYEEYDTCDGSHSYLPLVLKGENYYVHKKDVKRVDCPVPEEPSEEDMAFGALCEKGAPEAVQQALKDGRNPSACLHQAAEYNENPQVLRALVEAGADINVREKCGSRRTALMLLAAMPIYDPSAGETEQLKRARESVRDKLTILLGAGADINARDTTGQTALMAAAFLGRVANVDTLLKAGADKAIKDKDGHDALWHARQNDNAKERAAIVRLLQGGAKAPAAKKKP